MSVIEPLRVRAMVRRQAYVQRRAPQRWFDLAVWPVVDTVIWGSIGIFVEQQGGAARSGAPYMLSGILLMHVVYQSNVSMATGFMDETWSRNLLNLMVSPLKEAELLLSLIVTSLARLLIGLGVVALAAWGLYAFDVTTAGVGLVPVVAVLMLTGWTVALLVIGLMLRFGSGAEILTWGILFVVVALSGAFYPLDALPGALQPLATVLPSTHAFEAARLLLDGEPMPWDRIAAAGAGLVVCVPLALFFLLRMLHLFRARGYITRYS
ncbi:MAG: ABC transporter permease [Acidimicrobiia bacterium]|nr:ABC transporter permease [Acidimicrobiia bacterium]